MKTANDAPKRPALRYHGAKWRIAPWIIAHVPSSEYVDAYIEPYGGSAAVLLRKPRHSLEVWNDRSEDVYNFFAMLRNRQDELIDAIRWTPYSFIEYERAGETTSDPVEQARRFYVRSWLSIAGPTARWSTGFRRQKVLSKDENGKRQMVPAATQFAKVGHLFAVANRLRGVQFERDLATNIIERYDNPRTFFYCDPTYLQDTRVRWKSTAYEHEMSNDEHVDLAKVLRGISGLAAVSGYDHPLYDEIYTGWEKVSRMARVNGRGSRKESLWISPALQDVLSHTKHVEALEKRRKDRQATQPTLFKYELS